MTRFQTILARLCASAGCTMLHVDAPDGLPEALGVDGADMLADAIGTDGVAALVADQEFQMIVPGATSESEASGHIRMMRAIRALIAVEGSGITLVTGSGKVSTWRQGQAPGMETLAADHLAEALAHRAAGATAS